MEAMKNRYFTIRLENMWLVLIDSFHLLSYAYKLHRHTSSEFIRT